MDHGNNKNIFLATTALEEFWDTTKPIVFLGDWCLRYSHRNVWAPLNGVVLPGIWKDKKIFIDAYMYLQDVYERLLNQMAVLLDAVHEEQHSIRYWRIIIGPWLFHYIDALYDRFLCIQQAKSKFPIFDTIILSDDSFITPRSTSEYYSLSQNDSYNLQIYSRILTLEENNFRHKSYDIESKTRPNLKKNLLGIIKKKFFIACASSIALAKTRKSIYLVNPYFPKSSIIKIFLKSKGMVKPIFPAGEKIYIATSNKNMRNCFKKISLNNNEFEKSIPQLLPLDIPYSFLESYKLIKKETLRFPTKPMAIMSWVSWYFDEKFKIWAATAAESGCSLYGIQHGGNYGIDQYMQALDHEVAITDIFYSWGWNDSVLKERVIPMPVSIISGKKKFKKNKKNTKILFAGLAWARYLHRLDYPSNNHLGKYLEDQIKFLSCVSPGYQRFLRYRAFIHDYGLDISKRIQNAFPDLIMEGWNIPFQESLMYCRLFVCDFLSTVHAETLSLNVPTILFWDPDSVLQTADACSSLDNLHTVGILHYSPESAANKVNEVYDNVDDWWNGLERQTAILEFCDHYAKKSSNAIEEWTNELRKISR